MSIIHYTNFKKNPWGNGAEKRAAQIDFLLNKIESQVISYEALNKKNEVGRFDYYKNGYQFLKEHRFPLVSRLHIAKTGYEICNQSINLGNFSGKSVMIWESSRYSVNNIPYISNKAGLPVIALPHNLESLVPHQKSLVTLKRGLAWLKEELNFLRYCDVVFTISREEEWLLTLLGFKAFYLPYYPVPALEKYLLEIREKRKKSQQKDYMLLLGTILNPPTREGFIELIEFYRSSSSNTKLKVVGYATEQLAEELEVDADKIEILGSVDNNQLEHLLINCEAVIINQKPSSGALTKIQEMRIAGIPVIGNNLSFRSYYNLSGLYSFQTFSDLNKILAMKDYVEHGLPSRSVQEENRFCEIILKFLNR